MYSADFSPQLYSADVSTDVISWFFTSCNQLILFRNLETLHVLGNCTQRTLTMMKRKSWKQTPSSRQVCFKQLKNVKKIKWAFTLHRYLWVNRLIYFSYLMHQLFSHPKVSWFWENSAVNIIFGFQAFHCSVFVYFWSLYLKRINI